MLRSTTSYDLLGRITDYKEFASDGTGYVTLARYGIVYDKRSNVLAETWASGNYTGLTARTNNYVAGGYLISTVDANWRTNQDLWDTNTFYSYTWWDDAVQSRIMFQPDLGKSGTTNTYIGLDGYGRLTSAYVADGAPRQITYINDAAGQVLMRWDNKGHKKVWWYFDGKQVGSSGNQATTIPITGRSSGSTTYGRPPTRTSTRPMTASAAARAVGRIPGTPNSGDTIPNPPSYRSAPQRKLKPAHASSGAEQLPTATPVRRGAGAGSRSARRRGSPPTPSRATRSVTWRCRASGSPPACRRSSTGLG